MVDHPFLLRALAFSVAPTIADAPKLVPRPSCVSCTLSEFYLASIVEAFFQTQLSLHLAP